MVTVMALKSCPQPLTTLGEAALLSCPPGDREPQFPGPDRLGAEPPAMWQTQRT